MIELLNPGAKSPVFSLQVPGCEQEITNRSFSGNHLVLIFLPDEISEGISSSLAKYQEKISAFKELKANLLAICAANSEKVASVVTENGLQFPLVEDPSGQMALRFQTVESEQVKPAVYLIDDQGIIQASYDAERYPLLPNPLAVLRAIRRMNNMLHPAPLSSEDWILGQVDAPIILIEYSDYQCPHCIELHHLLDEILPAFKDKISLVHRHLPLRYSHPLAQQAAEAAEAAGAQGKFWEMHDRLFSNNGALEHSNLIQLAREIGLDVDKFTLELDNRKYQAAVNEDFKMAVKGLVKLPPTLFINGYYVEPPLTKENLVSRIQALLTQQINA